jgi:hypothetical protein
MTPDQERDLLLVRLTEVYNSLADQHTVLIGLVRALIVDRADADPEAGARMVEIVERAFELNESQRHFLAQMTTVAPSVTEESPSLMAH